MLLALGLGQDGARLTATEPRGFTEVHGSSVAFRLPEVAGEEPTPLRAGEPGPFTAAENGERGGRISAALCRPVVFDVCLEERFGSEWERDFGV